MTRQMVPFSVIEQIIRRGACVDSPNVLYRYINRIEEYADRCGITHAYSVYRRAYQVLIETICDGSVSMQWRELCLDMIHRPLMQLKRFVITDQDAKEYYHLEHELRVLSHFFMARAKCRSIG
ncbi:hypothetical protein DN730_09240 [Marinomonas piezotolerans]|uniref:Uncharacterized protein n=1 Tax=Marinomonas piezotolerans TaxID=2213058 RepID=A0A370U9W9_9GAMM|nr:hypothetical protein [Marinomonas piezotolerans]RDL44565.1 hypothetical protein DN730_09240 [Marinomonas piezotolerans]